VTLVKLQSVSSLKMYEGDSDPLLALQRQQRVFARAAVLRRRRSEAEHREPVPQVPPSASSSSSSATAETGVLHPPGAAPARPPEFAMALVRKCLELARDAGEDMLSRVRLEWDLATERTLGYGSDCSGADAPRVALWNLAAAVYWVARDLGADRCQIQVRYDFASEDPSNQGDSKRMFLTQNTPPLILFDGCDRDAIGVGHDCRENRFVKQPAVFSYVAGTVCVDRSSENCNKKPIDVIITDESGKSSRTLAASLQYIAMEQPGWVVLEYPHDRAFWDATIQLSCGVDCSVGFGAIQPEQFYWWKVKSPGDLSLLFFEINKSSFLLFHQSFQKGFLKSHEKLTA
jgi:hypothetical protein